MSVYPYDIDDDSTIIRVDDNITEVGGDAINQLRDAVFNMQVEMGINPSGSMSSITDRLNTSLDASGNIKASALTAVGLVTLPIDDDQVGTNAGIKEFKLDLDFSTSSLRALIQSNTIVLNAWAATLAALNTNFSAHLLGGPADNLRHVASHIDINTIPTDTRDSFFSWNGIRDKDGYVYAADNVADALAEIATNLGDHQNQTDSAHPASAISVDTTNFTTLETTSDTVQKALDNIDDVEELELGNHRSTMHSAGVPRDARSELLTVDGYTSAVVLPTLAYTYLAHDPPGTAPVDNVTVGDDLVKFNPGSGAAQFAFESQFSQVQPGDLITINYANGVEAQYEVDSTRFIPNSEWYVRLNGTNLFEVDGYALARIDRKRHDENIYGVLSVASANATPAAIFPDIRGGLIVGDPKGACVLGIGFDPNQLDQNHYKLYLQIYPTGDPSEKVFTLPYVDVTGNAGITTGQYTLESVVQATNNKFREAGYNYRFIAFAYEGNFGIMLADSIDGASFSIVSGTNNAGTLIEGAYVFNVVGDANPDLKEFDALGLGANGAAVASPAYQSSFVDSTAALLPTKIFVPKRRRYYVVNGYRYDELAAAPKSNTSRYWPANLTGRTPTASTVEVTYTVDLDLRDAELMPGKSIVVLPAVEFDDATYDDVDYGRFIIKEVTFSACVGPQSAEITVINGIYGTGSATSASSSPTLPVRLYFSEDSVWFNRNNVIDAAPSGDYHRLHEIYVTDTKKTFAHERAKMPANQPESPTVLATVNWRIHNVSPKLRGYRDTGGTDFKKWLRFYVISYDATSGEYDGYIGQRIPGDVGTLRAGPIITGRKNVSTRFYDESNVDYIDLEFLEPFNTTPGTAIITDPDPRYVDIEVFTSLQEDDELTLLSTCEVSWEPTVGDVVDLVKDARQVGSISEKEFTQSAKDFISAADRHLTANGIIRGFDYTGQNPYDDREFYFDGGVAIVNGAVVTANQGSVTIPEVYEKSAGTPDTLDWAICVNESGDFIPIILTSSKTQFYAQDNVSGQSYYLPSVTFTELVTVRKDLTIIYIINVTISSFAFNSATDARRYIENENLNIPFTLTMPEPYGGEERMVGCFKSFEQLLTWQSRYGVQTGNSLVKVRGTFSDDIVTLNTTGLIIEGDNSYGVAQLEISTLLTITTSVTFRNLAIILEAGAYIDATAGQPTFDSCNIAIRGTDSAILFSSLLTVKDCIVSYIPASPPAPGADFINSGGGAFYCDVASASNSILIENTEFYCTVNRFPFINVELDRGKTLDKFIVRGCTFYDTNANGKYGAAIAIIGTNSGSGAKPVVFNALIENNVCANYQGIYLTSYALTSADYPLSAVACRIINNSCGAIGYWTGAYTGWGTSLYGEDGNKMGSLAIIGNTAGVVGTCNSTGGLVGVSTGESGNVVIESNFTHIIYTRFGSTESDKYGKIHILDNTVEASDISNYSPAFASLTDGIYVSVPTAIPDSSDVVVNGNTVRSGYVDSTQYTFASGIRSSSPATISNNYVFEWTSWGIYLTESAIGGSLITNNRLFRNGSSVTGYIIVGSSPAGNTIIADNFFDSSTIDGLVSSTVSGVDSSVICRDNVNQHVTIDVAMSAARILTVNAVSTTQDSMYVDRPSPSTFAEASSLWRRGWASMVYSDGGSDPHSLRAEFNLAQIIPLGSRLVSATLTFQYTNAIPSGAKTVRIELHDLSDVSDAPASDKTVTILTDDTISIIESDLTNKPAWLALPENNLVCTAVCSDDTAASIFIYLKKVAVTYRW